MRNHTTRAKLDRRGTSLVEVIVAIIFLAGVLLSLAAATGLAARQMKHSQRDLNVSAALQTFVETLRSEGYVGIASRSSTGSESVMGYPMTWNVSGTDPKKVVIDIEWLTRSGQAVRDTVVLNLPALDTLQ